MKQVLLAKSYEKEEMTSLKVLYLVHCFKQLIVNLVQHLVNKFFIADKKTVSVFGNDVRVIDRKGSLICEAE